MSNAMKYSGIPWIGDIPINWEVKRLKNLANDKDSLIMDGDWIESNVIESNGIRYFTTGNIGDGVFKEQGQGFISEETFNALNCTMVYAGDLVFSRLNYPMGRSCIIPNKYECCVVAVDNVIFRPNKDVSKKYLMYVSMCNGFQNENALIARGATMQRMSRSQLVKVYVPTPPINAQKAIAEYLDKKCSEIDELISLQEKIIDELTAYKQSIITEAVTKGLNPDVPMKDSGIDWIGKIPDTWKIPKTLWVLEMPITDGPHTTPELFDTGIPFVSAEAVSCGNGGIDFSHIRGYISQSFYDECCLKYTPKKGDVYMIKSGATTGRVSIVDTDRIFTIWSPLAVFRANTKLIVPRYLFYSIQGEYYQKQVSLNWTFGTQQNIGMRTLETLLLVLPSIEEQEFIVHYLDKKCSEIDEMISIKQSKIESLKEYKKSIIYECVTGKKDVI